jgi:hypothetical protein
VLETVSHRLVAEVARTTLASVVLMASSPSRLDSLTAVRGADGTVDAKWSAAVERGVTGYRVRWQDVDGKVGGMRVVKATTARLAAAPKGATIQVRAIGARGLEGWDWAQAGLAD